MSAMEEVAADATTEALCRSEAERRAEIEGRLSWALEEVERLRGETPGKGIDSAAPDQARPTGPGSPHTGHPAAHLLRRSGCARR
ncbi:hypothetical protein GCM10027294_22420 [Marinactinospora endophytica]